MLDKLEMFIALANERHFGAAADLCGVTQPTLSSAIKKLEDQLGVQLVYRGSRFQGLTPEGQRVLDWARRIVSDTRTMREEMRASRRGLSGNLRIGVIPTALPMVVGLVEPFTKRHPNVRVAVLSRASGEILQQIDTLELDAGITYLDNEPLGRMTAVPIYHESYRLLVHRNSPLARQSEVTWAEAAGVPLCLLTSDMQNRRIIAQHLATAGVQADAMVESNSMIALVSHVMTGRWASIVPVKLAQMFSADAESDPRAGKMSGAQRSPAVVGGQNLTSIPIRAADARHLVGLIVAHREPHTPVLGALLDEARRIAEPDAG
ncbi:MAG: LysR family transcriptional regulator [Paracoccaceae bacterium]|nr:LysR family transcriptional regulator [Paracoccaceae bacterium]